MWEAAATSILPLDYIFRRSKMFLSALDSFERLPFFKLSKLQKSPIHIFSFVKSIIVLYFCANIHILNKEGFNEHYFEQISY